MKQKSTEALSSQSNCVSQPTRKMMAPTSIMRQWRKWYVCYQLYYFCFSTIKRQFYFLLHFNGFRRWIVCISLSIIGWDRWTFDIWHNPNRNRFWRNLHGRQLMFILKLWAHNIIDVCAVWTLCQILLGELFSIRY